MPAGSVHFRTWLIFRCMLPNVAFLTSSAGSIVFPKERMVMELPNMGSAKRPRPTIGEVIKAARLRRKMKAEDVGRACNVSRSRVYQWESSDFIFPKNLKPLSEALRIPFKKLQTENKKAG